MQAPTSTSSDGAAFASLTSIDRLDRRFDAFCDYAQYTLGHSLATLAWYRTGYRTFRTFLIGRSATLGADIRRDLFALDDFIASIRARGCQASTVVNYYRGLKAFFSDLERRDGIPSPFRGHRPPMLPSRVPKARSPEECRRILDTAANIPWKCSFERTRAVALLGIMMYAGLRKGEVLRLRVSHVNLAEGTIFIERGKGRGGGKDRMAYCPPELPHLLRDYARERSRLNIEPPEFFCGLRGRPLSDSTLRRTMRRIRRASGVPFSMHSLRHSFVTMLLKSGVPLHVASELAGHTDLRTTAHYLRVFDEEKRQEIRRFRLY
jgi:Site-specific recombinase XerD